MKSTLELWLVRHGETTSNSGGLLAGWSDVVLTKRGEEQARALHSVLEGKVFAGVWSSDLQRAVSTARLAYGEPQQRRCLREINFGDLEGQPWDRIPSEHRSALLDFEGFCAPGGEDLVAFEARVREFVNSLEHGRHLIFTHGGVVRVLTRHMELDRFVSNGALIALHWTSQEIVFIEENHLKEK